MVENFSAVEVAAFLIVLVAVFSFINQRFFRVQPTIALVVMGAITAALIVFADFLTPSYRFVGALEQFLDKVDFRETFLNGMLSFLLFAGALHVDISHIRKCGWPILVLATVGVLISTAVVGGAFWLVTQAIGTPVPPLWCFVFGALISPTDPVAVLAIMKSVKVPESIEATVAGEALFNDGVAIAAFTVLAAAATSGEAISLMEAGHLFLLEGVGGVVLGLGIGLIAFLAMRMIDDYKVELIISLAAVMGGYALASALHTSGPIAMATAGLLLGNHGVQHAMSETVRDYMLKFWEVLDELLNASLFLLIGLFSITLAHGWQLVVVGLAAVPVALLARAVSVGLPLPLWRKSLPYGSAFPILVWGGLRGGISIALVLSLPPGPTRDVLMAATYVVVLFSVVGQGSTLTAVLRRVPLTFRRRKAAVAPAP